MLNGYRIRQVETKKFSFAHLLETASALSWCCTVLQITPHFMHWKYFDECLMDKKLATSHIFD